MCEMCYCNPCREGCPNAPEPPIYAKCRICGEPIYYGDDYYEIDDHQYCEECVEDARTTAEVEWDD